MSAADGLNDLLTPEWPAPARVRAVCTLRRGGASQAPFDQRNLALHVGDRADDVLANRAALQAAIGARPVFLDQTHGADGVDLTADSPDGLRADVGSTQAVGVACTVMVADCLPVLLCDAAGHRVAAVHAGWRGLAGGVLASAVLRTCKADAQPAVRADALIAWLGPCIGPRAFEVGPDVRQAFVSRMPAAMGLFKPCGQDKWSADLAGLARLALLGLGVRSIHGNDASDAWCTVGNPSMFFSHRRDGARRAGGVGGTGRFAACVWRID